MVPIAERSYSTFAWVAELSVTESTLDVTATESGLDAKALIDDANCEPFCSSWTRLRFGVAELKNVSQLLVICETPLGEPPLAEEPALGGTAGADAAVGCTCDGAAENEPCAF